MIIVCGNGVGMFSNEHIVETGMCIMGGPRDVCRVVGMFVVYNPKLERVWYKGFSCLYCTS